jgi:hypothetical protein
VLGDVVIDDGVNFSLAGVGEDADRVEGFDGQPLGFLEAGGGELMEFFRVIGGLAADGLGSWAVAGRARGSQRRCFIFSRVWHLPTAGLRR